MNEQVIPLFWDHTPNRQYPGLPPCPDPQKLEVILHPLNQCLPLNRIVVSPENEGNMNTLRRFAHTAYKRYDHSCRGCNFGIFAPSGQGKTFIVKQFAETVGLPFVLVQSSTLSDTWMLFQLISEASGKKGLPVTPTQEKPGAEYYLPPMIIFFDEAHLVARKLMKGGLLNAMESDDGLLQVKQPGVKGNTFTVDCSRVCWTAATTEKGMLFDAFANRLGTCLEWAPAGSEEVATIVKQNLERRTDELPFAMPIEVCRIVARYHPVPREAINFAIKVVQQKDMKPEESWETACQRVREDGGLDTWGFNRRQIAILTALGQRITAKSRLAIAAECRVEQLERCELPKLMDYRRKEGPLVVALSRGMAITEAGLQELNKRGIPHKGYVVTAEHYESRKRK